VYPETRQKWVTSFTARKSRKSFLVFSALGLLKLFNSSSNLLFTNSLKSLPPMASIFVVSDSLTRSST